MDINGLVNSYDKKCNKPRKWRKIKYKEKFDKKVDKAWNIFPCDVDDDLEEYQLFEWQGKTCTKEDHLYWWSGDLCYYCANL